jgi:hypothetical protein
MPYKDVWVKPDVFMRYRGVIIYYTYRYNNVNDCVSEYHYTTNEEDTDYKEPGDGFVFDVRELETWIEPPHPPYINTSLSDERRVELEAEWDKWHEDHMTERYAKMAIRNAIKKGLLVDGVMQTAGHSSAW